MEENGVTTTQSGSLNLKLGVKFKLLDTPLFAGIQKTTVDGYEVLLIPTDNIAGNGMSIEKMIEEINKLSGKKEGGEQALDANKVTEQLSTLNPNSGVNWKEIRIILNQAFLYYKKDSTNSSVKYAISITVNAKELLPSDMGLINLDYLTLSVWNTTRPNVLARMGLLSNTDLLGE